MLDFLFRFNVLNTAFSVIGKEIGQKLGALGGRWFTCLCILTLYFFISEWWNNLLYMQVSTLGVVGFLISNGYLSVINRLRNVKYLNLLDIGFVKVFSGLLLKLSFPVVLWRYVWGPINSGLRLAGNMIANENSSWCYAFFLKGLAAVLLCIVVRLCCQRPNSAETISNNGSKQTRVPPPVPKRPPSARIQAMRNRQSIQPNCDNSSC